jgi:VWFA-related protein
MGHRHWISMGAIAAMTLTFQGQQEPSTGFKLQTGTRLVVVDVTTQDSQGHPVHSLKASDFELEENKKPEAIKNFEEHSAAATNGVKPQAVPAMPPGSFTNYTPVASDSPLNVILLDTLNTPMTDQNYVRKQLQQYVKHANPNMRVAIFGLATHLVLLQGFTSDPAILKDAAEHRLIPQGSILLNDPNGTNTNQSMDSARMNASAASASALSAMQQFESEEASYQTQVRIRYTLDAFNQMARYLASFPGRKNLIWFSGSFPIAIFGDPTTTNPFAAQADFSTELRETTSLLDKARIAVYPVDAGGLQVAPTFDAQSSGRSYAANPRKAATDISRFTSDNENAHLTMDEIAEDTGGHAFYNTNNLAEAVSKAVNTGASYYTLSYAPSDSAQDGSFRNIHVALRGEAAARGYKLTYRRGYFSDNPATRQSISSVFSLPSPIAAGTAHYGDLVMEHGAPAPTEILFKASVQPASATNEDTVAENNVLNPASPAKGPFRRYQVLCTALGKDFDLSQEADGSRRGSIEFVTYVYDSGGKLVNIAGQTFQLNLTADNYTQLMKTGVSAMLQVSTPAKGESFFRIAVHDIHSGRFGVIEVPVSIVEHLSPVVATAAPSGKN